MKVILKNKEDNTLHSVPDGDLFVRENEVYFKTKERASVGANNILCFSVRTGERHWICPETVVRKVRSITVEYEE